MFLLYSVMKFVCLCLLLATVVYGEDQTTIYPELNEADLVTNLLRNYQKIARPVNDPSTPVVLSVGMAALSINQLDEENQVIELDTYIRMSWKDENLLWDPLRYMNITNVRLPPTDIWIPDLTLYSATPASSLFPPTQTRALVYSNGTVLWVPMFTIRSRCPTHRGATMITCNVKMGSWTLAENHLYIKLFTPGVDLNNFINNNHNWGLKGAVSSRESKLYPCCPDEYSAVHFNFTVVRSASNKVVETMNLG